MHVPAHVADAIFAMVDRHTGLRYAAVYTLSDPVNVAVHCGEHVVLESAAIVHEHIGPLLRAQSARSWLVVDMTDRTLRPMSVERALGYVIPNATR